MDHSWNVNDWINNSGVVNIDFNRTVLPIKMKKYGLKFKTTDLYKKMVIIVISFSILFTVFFYLDYLNNKTQSEYFYDFEGDTINSFPKGFVGVGRIDTTKVVAWNLDDGHKGKVAQIVYLEENPYDYTGTELNTLFNKATKGFISFDIYFVEELGIAIDVCQEDPIYDRKDDISIRITYGDPPLFTVVDSFNNIKEMSSVKLLKWYHFEIEFNCERNEWSIEIYSKTRLLSSKNLNFYIQPLYLCQLYFATYKLGNKFYIDNVNISLVTII